MNNNKRKGTPFRFLLVLATGLIASVAPLFACAVQSYVATPLGTLGGSYTWGRGINAVGDVTGASYTTGDAARHAFLYSGQALTDLGTLGGSNSVGNRINASRQIVGSSETASGHLRAFMYSSGTMIDLGTLGGAESLGQGINDSGQITGGAQTSSGQGRAFLYSGGHMTDLGTLGGGSSVGLDINNNGEVTGFAETATGEVHAFLYSGGVMIDLGTLGGMNSHGYGINNSGQVTGLSETSIGQVHAFLYSAGTMTDLGALGGGSAAGYAINARGQILGMAMTSAGQQRAFLYTDGAMYDLNTLVVTGLGGVVLDEPGDINDSGQIAAEGFRLDPAQGLAVEYHEGSFDHYFVTAMPSEIGALDAGTFPGWKRTGESFPVYPLGSLDTADVCRFWSGQTFAPKSSHFYTPFEFECEYVKGKGVWQFEGKVFGLKLSDASGNCPSGTTQLYRLYNNGKSGAPNHRYTTSSSIRADMIAQGWAPEGSGLGVIGCVPLP